MYFFLLLVVVCILTQPSKDYITYLFQKENLYSWTLLWELLFGLHNTTTRHQMSWGSKMSNILQIGIKKEKIQTQIFKFIYLVQPITKLIQANSLYHIILNVTQGLDCLESTILKKKGKILKIIRQVLSSHLEFVILENS